MNKIYLAYGSNMNLMQMRYRCPNARALATTVLRGWKLVFRGTRGSAVATIEPQKGAKVCALLWAITEDCERALDRYEGFPRLYRKETVTVRCDGNTVEAMVYILNDGFEVAGPSSSYYATIQEGYRACGLKMDTLANALFEATKERT